MFKKLEPGLLNSNIKTYTRKWTKMSMLVADINGEPFYSMKSLADWLGIKDTANVMKELKEKQGEDSVIEVELEHNLGYKDGVHNSIHKINSPFIKSSCLEYIYSLVEEPDKNDYIKWLKEEVLNPDNKE